MSGMDMDSGSDPLFRVFNQVLARAYWYIIAGIVGFILLLRVLDYYQTWSRLVHSTIDVVSAGTRDGFITAMTDLTCLLTDYEYVEQERQRHTPRG
jgi:membrane protein required for beta-lactamase induction